MFKSGKDFFPLNVMPEFQEAPEQPRLISAAKLTAFPVTTVITVDFFLARDATNEPNVQPN